MSEWREDLQCNVVKISYSFATKKGVLYMADGDCCDMTGCVGLFERIDPAVEKIFTVSGKRGEREDTFYERIGTAWLASEFAGAARPEIERILRKDRP